MRISDYYGKQSPLFGNTFLPQSGIPLSWHPPKAEPVAEPALFSAGSAPLGVKALEHESAVTAEAVVRGLGHSVDRSPPVEELHEVRNGVAERHSPTGYLHLMERAQGSTWKITASWCPCARGRYERGNYFRCFSPKIPQAL